MLKIKAEALTNKNGVYYYQDIPYNGLAVHTNRSIIDKIILCSDGLPEQIESSRLLPSPPAGEHIDADSLMSEDSDDEPYLLNGIPFTGVSYVFNSNYLDGIQHIKDGCITKEISWYKNGQTATLDISDDDLSQEYWWNHDGTSKRVCIFTPPDNQLKLEFNDEGQLRGVTITNETLNAPQYQNNLAYSEFSSPTHIFSYPIAEKIILFGNGITDPIMDKILQVLKSSHVKKVSIRNTKATYKSLQHLQQIKNLSEVTITSDHLCANEVANIVYRSLADFSVNII